MRQRRVIHRRKNSWFSVGENAGYNASENGKKIQTLSLSLDTGGDKMGRERKGRGHKSRSKRLSSPPGWNGLLGKSKGRSPYSLPGRGREEEGGMLLVDEDFPNLIFLPGRICAIKGITFHCLKNSIDLIHGRI